MKKIIDKIKNVIMPKDDDSYEFMPVLSEIEERPLNPLGNTVFWLVIAFMVTAGLWMYFGKTDIVITARGQVIPNGEEKVVQSLDKGIVTAISVREGEYVEEGQVVAVVSPSEHEPELELNNLREEQIKIREQLAADNVKLNIASENKKRLESVRDILPQAQYDAAAVEVTELSHEISALSATLNELENKAEQIEKQTQILKSPVSGYVNKISVHTTGGVVTPAEKIMTIVPKDAPLIIKAKVLNKDAGFVEQGMPVSVKVDTFNFQKYGILNGEVTVVSPNTVDDEHLGPVYEIYIQPKETTLLVEGKEQTIKFGMETTNEIKTGKRRIIEFFIYPLIKYMDESIKVR